MEERLPGGEDWLPEKSNELELSQERGATPSPLLSSSGDAECLLQPSVEIENLCGDATADTNSDVPVIPDTRSLSHGSYSSALSSLTTAVCKICHCGEEVGNRHGELCAKSGAVLAGG